MRRDRADRATRALALLLALAAGIAIGRHSAGGGKLYFVEDSPDGRERLEFYAADRWGTLTHPNAEMPGHVRLTRIAGGETLGTSDTFDLFVGAPTVWTDKVVQVGTSAVYDRRTRKWSVEE